MRIRSVTSSSIVATLLLLLTLCVFPQSPANPSGGAGKSQQSTTKATLDGLLYDLKSPDAFRRREAVDTLGDKKVVAAIPELIVLWEDPDVEVRRTLVRALDSIGDMRAAAPLAKMLSDTDKEVRKSAIKALVDLYAERESLGLEGAGKKAGASFNPLSDDRNDVIVEPGIAVSAEVIQALADRLRDDEKGIRQDAAKALGVLRGRGALSSMLECLKAEKEKGVLISLMRSFYKIGDSSVGSDLLLFVYHDDKAVHDEAIHTLGLLRYKEAVKDLTKIYLSNVEERRKIFKIIPVSGPEDLQLKCFEALVRIAAPESKPQFVAALTHSDARYRQAGAEGLARLVDKEQITPVSRQRLKETKEGPKLAQSFALFRMGRREYIEDLIRGVENGDEQAFSYLLEFNKNEAPLLYPYLESANPKARQRVADVLGLIGDEQALKRLDLLSKDPSADVMASAVRATRRINARTNHPKKP